MFALCTRPPRRSRFLLNGQEGHIENFTLRTYGACPDAAQSPQFGANYYGGHVRVVWFNDDIPEGGTFELTFIPQGPLLGGVPGRTLVFRFPNKGFGGEVFLNDLPLGRYSLKASLFDGGDTLPLRLKKVFGDDEIAGTLSIDFDPEGGNLASLGHSGVRRFDVMLKP